MDTGILNVQDACIVLVKTEWNAAIVDELERGAIAELQKHEVKKIITVKASKRKKDPMHLSLSVASFVVIHRILTMYARL